MIASLFQVTLVVLIFATIEENFQSYYVFYGSLFFALIYVSSFRWLFEKASGAMLRAAGYRRAGRCWSVRARTSRRSRTRCASREIEPYGFVARSPVALMDGLRDFRSLEQLERHFDSMTRF